MRKIACILATLAVNFILSSMNLKRICEVGRGVGRLISDMMSYRNHYMCSDEATSYLNVNKSFLRNQVDRHITHYLIENMRYIHILC